MPEVDTFIQSVLTVEILVKRDDKVTKAQVLLLCY